MAKAVWYLRYIPVDRCKCFVQLDRWLLADWYLNVLFSAEFDVHRTDGFGTFPIADTTMLANKSVHAILDQHLKVGVL
jgi:hypothetical protein